MINKIKASFELSLFAFVLALSVILVGVYGVNELRELNKESQQLYENSLIPTRQLTQLRNKSLDILFISSMVTQKQIAFSDAHEKMKSNLDSIHLYWNEFIHTDLTEIEKIKASKTKLLLDRFSEKVEKLESCLQKNDSKTFNISAQKELYATGNSLFVQVNNLISLDLKIEKNISDKTFTAYNASMKRFIFFMILIFSFSAPLFYYLIKKNRKIISSLNDKDEKLLEVEKNYRDFINYAGDAILILDKKTMIVDLNESANHLFGYSREELLQMEIIELIFPDEIYPIEEKELIEENKSRVIYRKAKRKDGTFIDTEIINWSMEGDGSFAIIRDITERKSTEAIIKESEEKYRYLFNNNPAHIIIWDFETLAVLEVNNTILDAHGYSKNEWENMTILDCRYNDDHQNIKNFAALMLDSENNVFEMRGRYLKKNGEEMIMDVSSHKIEYNNRKAVLSLARDVTEQIKVENELKESEQKYDSLIKHAGDAIFVIKANADIVEVNTSACEMFGYNREEFVTMNVVSLNPSISLECFYDQWNLIKENKNLLTENKYLRKDGSIVEVEVNRKQLDDKSYLAIVRDITERKKIENELIENKEQLRLFIEHTPASLAMFDNDMNYIANSRRWLTDYGLENCSIIGKNHYEVFPEIIDKWKPIYDDCLKGNIQKCEEDSYVSLDGKMEWMRWEMHPWKRVSGEIGGVIMFVEVITERKKATEILQYQFENSPDTIVYVNMDHKIESLNRSIFGLEKNELIGMSCIEVMPEATRSLALAYLKRCLDTKQNQEFEIQLGYKNWFCGRIVPIIANDEVTHFMVVSTDITERKNIENELIESKEKLNLFIENSPASLAMFDNEMRYISVSRSWISDYNLSGQDIIGKSHYEVVPGISQEWKDIHQRCLQGNIEKKEEDFFIREDGKIEWIRWEVHPWNLASGEIGGIIMFVDIITERKQATELFKYQFENSPDTILYVNKQFKIESINRESLILPYETLIGQDCIEFLPKQSQPLVREKLTTCFETGENQEFEFELDTDNWTCARFVPIVTNGKITHIMIFSTDITTRKQAEQKLLQSEEQYRVLADNISDATVLVDKNFQIEYQNPAAERISGYSCEEAKSKKVLDFLHPDELKRGTTFFLESYNSPDVSLQNHFRLINKKGEIIWIEGTVVNLLNNISVESFVINYRDITNRKKLEEQQALMASIVNSSDDAIISKNIDGIVTSWNVGAEKILGYTAAEMIGKPITILVPSAYRVEEIKILNTVKDGRSVEHFETKRVKKNGELIDVSLTISPVRDQLGNVVGASKIMRDITDRKEVEEELIRYNDELKKTNSELDRFVYSASHDLRAPLKSILGLLNITKEYANSENSELLECLLMLNNSVLKLDGFIEDILSYSRNARMELDKDIINFEELTNKIRENHQYIEGINDFNVEIEINSESVFIADSKRLSVVLNNLFSNAFKYKDSSKENQYLKIEFSCNQQRAIIKLQDNGIGIADKDKEKIFNMFYRATMLSTGSGLGLYIVKETIDKLEGKINVESELGKGTRFTIEIPNQINFLDDNLQMLPESYLEISEK